MLKLLILQFILLLEALDQITESLCPISDMINDNPDQSLAIYFTYPIDVYQPFLQSNNYNINSSNDFTQYYTCSNPEVGTLRSSHSCTTKSFCPLSKTNIKTSNILSFNNECILQNEDNHINIIILGGSTTIGTNAGGCCCSNEIDSKCTDTLDNIDCKAQGNVPVYNCSWVGYFNRYLLTRTKVNYKLFNFASSGLNSKAMADNFYDALYNNNINHKSNDKITLTNQDIIFIDHSVNDAIQGYNDDESGSGLEYLIRIILKTYQDSPIIFKSPSMILLEMFPYPNKQRIHSYDYNTYQGNDYSKHYRLLSEYYNISLWSFKDFIWTFKSIYNNNLNDHKMMDYLLFNNIYTLYKNHPRVHPPWHVHLLYAELITNLFTEKFFINCFDKQTFNIPPPLTKLTRTVCDSSIDYLIYLDFSTNEIQASQNYIVNPIGSWNHIEEKPQKFGLVSAFTADDNRHSIKIILDKNIFTQFNSNQEFLLHFTYLKTYRNAGALEIDVCNQWIYIVDALWSFYPNTFISVPETYVYKLKLRYIQQHCVNEKEPFLLFDHYKHVSITADEDLARTSNQKFRIDKISLCAVEERRIN